MMKKIRQIPSNYTYSNIRIGKHNNNYFTLESANGNSKIDWYDMKFGKTDSTMLTDLSLTMFEGFDRLGYFLDGTRKKIFTIQDNVLSELKQYDLHDLKYSNAQNAASKSFLRGSRKVDGILTYSLININNNSLIASSFRAPYMYGDILVNHKELTLHRLSENTLEPIWTRDYTHLLDHIEGMNRVINPIIGVHSNIFVFSYQGKWLIGVEIDTGKIAWKVSGSWSRSQLLENGDIFVMVGSQMRLLDIKTGKLIGEYGEIEGKIGSQRMNYTFIGDHVILTGRPSDTIGAYNTKTYKYDWIYKEEGTQWSPQPMKYYHPYLFLNDAKGNLHVFKVDDGINFINRI